MENQHKKSNQLSLLNIIVIVCYLCLLTSSLKKYVFYN